MTILIESHQLRMTKEEKLLLGSVVDTVVAIMVNVNGIKTDSHQVDVVHRA
jgi:hypothetical protein